MALTIKHAGRGKYNVLDGETVVDSGLSKEDAEAMAGTSSADDRQPEPIPTHAEDGRELTEAERRRLFEQRLDEAVIHAPEVTEPLPEAEGVVSTIPTRDADGRTLSEIERRRLYETRMNADRQVANDRALAPYKAMVFKDFDEDAADAIWRQMEPILKAGAEGVRRNLGRNMRVRG